MLLRPGKEGAVFSGCGEDRAGCFPDTPSHKITHLLFMTENPMMLVDVKPPGISRYGNTFFS